MSKDKSPSGTSGKGSTRKEFKEGRSLPPTDPKVPMPQNVKPPAVAPQNGKPPQEATGGADGTAG